jgi:hypothetical protein
MLLEKDVCVLESSGVQEVKRATIKTSPKIFNFFADQTYANKPRAICRELVANAWDSHQMAGKGELAVEVWLPTILDPVFRVRDFGLGMNHSFMMNEFMCYADGSTKDQSNIAIGGFGIGSKSPFAYVDQYTVSSRFDGVESVYSVFKDAEGIPAIGLLGQRATSDENGVEVSFPVKPEDFATFEEAAFEALRFFEPLPDIKNATEGVFNPPDYVAKGKNWGMRHDPGDLQIIMGGVMYPVNVSNLTYKFPSDSPARKLLSYGLDLRVPIGTCSVALSREALSYDDKTVAAIGEACTAVIDEVAETMSTMFDQYDSAWEAKVALQREIGENQYHRSARGSFLAEHAKWRGSTLTLDIKYPMLGTRRGYDNVVRPCTGYSFAIVQGLKNRESRRSRSGYSPVKVPRFIYPSSLDTAFQPAKLAYLVIDDLPQKASSRTSARIKMFLEDNEVSKDILVIRPDEDQQFDHQDIIDAFGKPEPFRVLFTSELDAPYVEKRVRPDGKVRPKVRMFTFDGRSRSWGEGPNNNINPGVYGKSGVNEIPYELQPDTGILVVMENFEFSQDVRIAMRSGVISWSEVHFANSGDAKKLKGWTPFMDEFERRKKSALAQYPDLAKRVAVYGESHFQKVFDFFRSNAAADFTSRKPLGVLFKLYRQYVEPYDADQKRLAEFVTPKLPAGVKPEELIEKFKTKQPKARRLMQVLPAHLDEADLQLFMENL